jgi:hypothetical protein
MLTHFVVGNGLAKNKSGKKICGITDKMCGRTEKICGKTVFLNLQSGRIV